MKINWDLDLGVKALDARRHGREWVARASGGQGAVYPGCGSLSGSRKGRYCRRLQDLPMQGSPVTLTLEVSRWRCRNPGCSRESFVEPLPGVAPPHARRTHRVAELARFIGYSAGGRPTEKILKQLGLPQSDDTVLRNLKENARGRRIKAPRVVGIDDWSWLKGRRYRTVVVDLERRVVIDVLPDRSAAATADWLSDHPEVEVVSRDRCGLYAQCAARGAPQARQVADRFHLLDNLRLTIEQQPSREQRGVESARHLRDPITPITMADYQGHGRQPELLHHRRLARSGRRAQWLTKFDRLKELQRAGYTASSIKRETGLHWKTITKWLSLDSLPERRAMAPKATTPAGFTDYLAKRWAEGHKSARHLLPELKARGYAGDVHHVLLGHGEQHGFGHRDE